MSLKKILLIVLLVFVAAWIYADPDGGARVARSLAVGVWELVRGAAQAVIDFLDSVL